MENCHPVGSKHPDKIMIMGDYFLKHVEYEQSLAKSWILFKIITLKHVFLLWNKEFANPPLAQCRNPRVWSEKKRDLYHHLKYDSSAILVHIKVFGQEIS